MMHLSRPSKRHMLLLEVLIAFALVVLCALPLIYPHVAMLRAERHFVDTIQVDHMVNLLYADIMQKLYQNDIPWETIASEKKIPIDEALIKEIGYKNQQPFTGTYQFVILKQKPQNPDTKTFYLVKLIFTFTPRGGIAKKYNPEDLTYTYQIPIEQRHASKQDANGAKGAQK